MKVSISVGVQEETAARFRQIAEETGDSLSAVVERLALAGLAREQHHELDLAAIRAAVNLAVNDALDRFGDESTVDITINAETAQRWQHIAEANGESFSKTVERFAVTRESALADVLEDEPAESRCDE